MGRNDIRNLFGGNSVDPPACKSNHHFHTAEDAACAVYEYHVTLSWEFLFKKSKSPVAVHTRKIPRLAPPSL